MPKLFLGNIPHTSSESQVQDWIESQGFCVESVEVIYDRATGNPRGFGFASMNDEAEVQKAITALNGQRMDGRVITVNQATPLTYRTSHAVNGRQRTI